MDIDLEGQSAQADLNKQISTLTTTAQDMKKIVPPKPDIWKDVIEPQLLTPRQIAKKIMMSTTGTIPGVGGSIPETPKVDEEAAHLAIYGKLMKDSDGNLLDNEVQHPECVNKTLFKKNISSDSSDNNDIYPMKEKAHLITLEVKNSIKGLGKKMEDLEDGVQKAALEIGIGVAAFVDAATNIPKPQPSLAISAILGIFSSISKLQAKVIEIVPLLTPLEYLVFLLPKASPIISTVTTTFVTPLTILVTTIGGFSAIMSPILALIPSPAQVTDIVKQSTSATLKGVVKDVAGNPINGASVKVNTMDAVSTDGTGAYTVEKISISGGGLTGTATITVVVIGHATVTDIASIEAGKTTTKDITLT